MKSQLTIGELSRRCRLPVSTLRYYHEIGLLEPAFVDPASNYRYYEPGQVDTAVLVSELRLAGVSLHQMQAVLSAEGPDIEVALESIKCEIELRIEADRVHLSRIDALINDARKGSMADSVSEVEGLLLPLTFVDRVVRTDRVVADVRRAFVELRRQAGFGRGGYAASFPLDLDSSHYRVRVYVESVEREHGAALSITHDGDHQHLWRAYRALLDASHERGHIPQGRVVERYLRSEVDGPATEVLLPIQESSSR